MDSRLPGKILLIEDDTFYHKIWRHHLTDDQLQIISSFDEFRSMAASLEWDGLAAVITDFYLENDRTAWDVIQWMKQEGITKKVFISSEINADALDGAQAFAGIVSKSPKKAFEEVARLLSL